MTAQNKRENLPELFFDFGIVLFFLKEKRAVSAIIFFVNEERETHMDILSELNEKQGEAATSDARYLRIIAGAGTGKTRTLTYRIAHLLDSGVPPFRIVAITFTNKVAKEMTERVRKIMERSDTVLPGYPLIATFHGFCYRFLKKEILALEGYSREFSIADDEDQNTIYKEIFKTMTKGESKDFCKAITGKISALKTEGKYPDAIATSDVPMGAIYTFSELSHVYQAYQDYLRKQNLLDFDDLLILAVKVLSENPAILSSWQNKYSHFLVDEFQDTNALQYRLLRLLLGGDASLTVVGDPDQTIYTWRGAKNDIIKDRLARDFPGLVTVVLDENYRSTQEILDHANVLIRHNRDRVDKNLVAASHVQGDKVTYNRYYDAENEGRDIASIISGMVRKGTAKFKDFAVIYRSNYLSNSLERQLTGYKIPYEIYGGMKFYERAEIKDALAYLKLVLVGDDLSFQRILKAPNKGIGEVTLEKAKDLERSLGDEESLLTVFRDHQEELRLQKGTKLALADFYKAYDAFAKSYRMGISGEEVVSAITTYLEDTGFLAHIRNVDRKESDKLSFTASSSTSRLDNVMELLRTIQNFFESDYLDEEGKNREPDLEDFLIEVALQSDQDTIQDDDKVSLMTGHVSKGLEFPYVFVTGMNEMVFPSYHSLVDGRSGALEEERRLFFVCMTRAQKKLWVSSFGGINFRQGVPYMPSRFVKEAELVSLTKERPNNYQAHLGGRRPSTSLFPKGIFNPATIGSLNSKPSSTSEKYEVGDKVVHVSFGIGVVKDVDGNKILVDFPSPYGQKKLVVGFKAFRKMREGE